MSKVKVKNDLINGLAKIKSEPIDKPVTTQRVIETFFKDFYEDTKVFKIKDGKSKIRCAGKYLFKVGRLFKFFFS